MIDDPALTIAMLHTHDSGLSNEDLVHARAVLNIPAYPAFSSLNLAQAVSICSYEWHCAATSSSCTDTDLSGVDDASQAEIEDTKAVQDQSANVAVRRSGQLASTGDVANLMAR